jgi:SAM-dependent methyltransferase
MVGGTLGSDPAGVLAAVGLRSGMDVIDLCSGDGWFTLQIARVAQHVTAIDIDPNLLEVARHRLMESGVHNCKFIVASGRRRIFLPHGHGGRGVNWRLTSPLAKFSTDRLCWCVVSAKARQDHGR